MKKSVCVILLCLIACVVCAGCGDKTADQGLSATMGNPWSDWSSIGEAESAVGFSFGLPEVVADSYNAAHISTMNNELIQIVYRDGDFEVCVRKQKGEDQDISGDYTEYDISAESAREGGVIKTYRNFDNNAVRQLISYDGYSWSLVASNGYRGDTNDAFLNLIFNR